MRRLSAHVQDLLRHLSLFGSPAHRWGPPDALRQLAESGEPGSLRAIAPHLFLGDEATVTAACAAADSLIPLLPAAEVSHLDQVVRESSWLHTSSACKKDAALKRFRSRLRTSAQSCLWSMHPSGFVRQAAISELRSASEPWVLPFLLTRLNDWVEPVRAEARASVESRLSAATVQEILHALPAIVPLAARGRADHRWVLDAVSAALLSPDARPKLRAAMASPNTALRRAAFGLALRADENDRASLLRDALSSDDAVLRLRAARELRPLLRGEALMDFVRSLATDPSMPLRREGLYAATQSGLPDASDLLRVSLLDRHASIRHLARVYLRDYGAFDPASFYRAALARHPATAAEAVDGLGETGVAADAPTIRGFLTDPSPRVRTAAVRAYSRVLGDSSSNELLPFLGDPNPRVARTTARSLRPATIDVDLLLAYLAPDRAAHTRRYALRLLASASPVHALAPILQCCAASELLLSRSARSLLQTWRLAYQRAMPEDTQAARAALDQARPHLSREESVRAERAVQILRLAQS